MVEKRKTEGDRMGGEEAASKQLPFPRQTDDMIFGYNESPSFAQKILLPVFAAIV
jgi:hypothetical protein